MTVQNAAPLASLKLQQISSAETPFYIQNLVHRIAAFLRVISWGFVVFFLILSISCLRKLMFPFSL